MKRRLFLVLVGLLTVFVLAGCMEKKQDDVVRDLEAKVKGLKSYQAEAKLSIKTGNEPQEYKVEIWHKEPSFLSCEFAECEKRPKSNYFKE